MAMLRTMLMAATLALVAGSAAAQPGPGASAPRMGMGPGMHGRWGPDDTPGWAMMSEQERKEHRERMRSMDSYDACKTYRDQHHAQMMERAKERGGKPLAEPRRDACRGLQR